MARMVIASDTFFIGWVPKRGGGSLPFFSDSGCHPRGTLVARMPVATAVDDCCNARATDKLTFGWYGRRDFKGLFAMQNLVPVEAELRGLHPESRRCQDRRDGRKGKEVLLVDEAQLPFVHWIGAQAKPERIEDRVFPRKLLPNFGWPPVQELVVVERHGADRDSVPCRCSPSKRRKVV